MAMPEGIKGYIEKEMIPSVKGLEYVAVSDRDGVMLVEARAEDVSVPAGVPRPQFLGVFSIASEQASKLGISKNKAIISYYTNHQVVQFNCYPLVLTFVAQVDSNTGMIYSLAQDIFLKDAITALQSAVNTP